ncbi:hypothetical protein [Tritonibacter sp. SIMBA_163]|uniref:hypothetical protein n=1 Tax=Tritonibacter sp. SIMBA_163 TaxID=3080868 RepID=UPI00398182AF
MRIPFTDLSPAPLMPEAGIFAPRIPAPLVFAALATLCGGFAVWVAQVYYSPLSAALHEGGPVEVASAVLWGLCAIMVIYFAPGRVFGSQWQILALFLLLFSREMDFDKRFLDDGILQLRLYSGDAPYLQKIVGLVVILMVLAVAWRLCRRNLPVLWAEVRRGAAWAWCSCGALGLLVVAKSLDGIGRKLADFGLTLDPQTVATAMIYEELFELFAVVVIVWAISLLEARVRRDHLGGSHL